MQANIEAGTCVSAQQGIFYKEPCNITAADFSSYDELQASATTANDAMLSLGPTLAEIGQIVSGEERRQFLKLYGAALHRRGKMQQLVRSAESGEIPHLTPPAPAEEKLLQSNAIEMVAPAAQLNRSRPLLWFLKSERGKHALRERRPAG